MVTDVLKWHSGPLAAKFIIEDYENKDRLSVCRIISLQRTPKLGRGLDIAGPTVSFGLFEVVRVSLMTRAGFFQRRFRDPIRVPRISNRVPRIREHYHRASKIRENRVPRFRKIGSLQIQTGFLTVSLKKTLSQESEINGSQFFDPWTIFFKYPMGHSATLTPHEQLVEACT